MPLEKKELGATLAIFILSYKKTTLLALLILSVLLSIGLKHIQIQGGYRYFFGKGNPQLEAFERLQKVYAKDDSVLIIITPDSGDIFTQRSLQAIEYLTEKSWQVPFSSRVDSITNFQHIQAEGDDLIVEKLVVDAAYLDKKQLDYIRRIAITEPSLFNRLLTDKTNVTAINITVNPPKKNPLEIPQIAQHTRKMIQEFRELYPDHQVHLTGLVMLSNNFYESNIQDMTTLTPTMYCAIILILLLLFRSIWLVGSTLIIILISMTSAMGFAGWVGIPVTPPSAFAPTATLTLAIADCVHLLVTIISVMRQGASKNDAIVESLRINLQPIFLTSLTTSIGFLSLNFSDCPPFQDLGNIVAFGVMASFVYSILLIPILVSILPVKIKKDSKVTEGSVFFIGLGNFLEKHKTFVVASFILLTTFLAVQIPKFVIDDNYLDYFSEDDPFIVSSQYAMDNLAGFHSFYFNLKAEGPQAITDPKYLNKIDEFANWYQSQPDVAYVSTFSEVIKRLNRNMHQGDAEYYRIPEDRELIAQLLLLYEMSLPYGFDLNNQIDIDKSSTKMMIKPNEVSNHRMAKTAKEGQDWLKSNAPESMQDLATGSSIIFAHITERNLHSMIPGTAIAFMLISIILCLAFRSIKYGLISLIPNLIPLVITFGLWSLLSGKAGIAITMVAPISVGIIVDDTTHFLCKYARARKQLAMDTKQSIQYALCNVGPAMVITSLILVVGFSVMMLSDFFINWTLGVLTAMSITVALLVDFLLLPALLMTIKVTPRAGESR